MAAGGKEWLAEVMQDCGLNRNEGHGDRPK
jgi:hypothetical protein